MPPVLNARKNNLEHYLWKYIVYRRNSDDDHGDLQDGHAKFHHFCIGRRLLGRPIPVLHGPDFELAHRELLLNL